MVGWHLVFMSIWLFYSSFILFQILKLLIPSKFICNGSYQSTTWSYKACRVRVWDEGASGTGCTHQKIVSFFSIISFLLLFLTSFLVFTIKLIFSYCTLSCDVFQTYLWLFLPLLYHLEVLPIGLEFRGMFGFFITIFILMLLTDIITWWGTNIVRKRILPIMVPMRWNFHVLQWVEPSGLWPSGFPYCHARIKA